MNLLIDFDSTIVGVETVDFLFDILRAGTDEAVELSYQIKAITQAGMLGEIPFEHSLSRRLELLRLKPFEVGLVIEQFSKELSPSFVREHQRLLAHNLHVISGGFREIITPVLTPFGIEPSKIHANQFDFGRLPYARADSTNPLAQQHGKVNVVKTLGLVKDTVMVGDGWTDYEVKQHGQADYFVCYAEFVRREKVCAEADFVVRSFSELLNAIEMIELGRVGC